MIVFVGGNPSCDGRKRADPDAHGAKVKGIVLSNYIYGMSALRLAPMLALLLTSREVLADCTVVTGNETAGCTLAATGQSLTIQSGGTLNGWINASGAGAVLNVQNGGTFRFGPTVPGAPVGGFTSILLSGPNQTVTNNGTLTANSTNDVLSPNSTGFMIVNGATGVIANNSSYTLSNAIHSFAAGASGTIINSGTISAVGGAGEGTIFMSGAGGLVNVDNRLGGVIRGNVSIAYNVSGNKQTLLRNAGTISTGVAGGTAISLGSGNDSVTLEPTSSITGIVNGQGGIDTLALGGGAATNGNFDIGLIGPAAQYRNFEVFQKVELGTWTLNGSASGPTSWSVNGGTLRLGSSSLGITSITAAGGDIGYNNGVVNASQVILNAPARLIVDGTDSATQTGIISGSGAATKSGDGSLLLTGANTYTGGTTISAGTLQLGNGGTSGSIVGDVTNNGALVFNRSDVSEFAGKVSGTGSVAQNGLGTTILSADNTYTGGTTISAGTLQLGNGGTSGSIVGDVIDNGALIFNRSDLNAVSGSISGTGSVTQNGTGITVLSGNNTWSGRTTVAMGTLRAGAADTFSAASDHSVSAGATLDTAGFNQSVATLHNSGTASLLSDTAGSTLTVNGPYVGNGGLLRLGTGMTGSSSVSDRLVINGPNASASGNTTIQIASLGGLGALTTGNGIEVVSGLNGANTTAQTSKDAFRLANGHVDGGAYEYRLYAADSQGAGENWYLRTTVRVVPGQPSTTLPDPANPTASLVTAYRAEVPLLVALPAQLRQADLAMLGNLHQRIGDELSEDASGVTPSTETRRSWARAVYSNLDVQQPGVANTHSEGSVNGLQAGTDLYASGNWRAGVYVGHLDGRADVTGNAHGVTGPVGSNSLQSDYLGAYATWLDTDGMYVDSVLQRGSHSYSVRPDTNPNVSGNASSLTASIETGKPFPLSGRWSIEPQAQLIYQSTNPENVDLSGAEVHTKTNQGWIARLGARVTGDMITDAGKMRPYTRLNVYHASFGDDKVSFTGDAGETTITSPGSYSSAEAAVGTTLALTSNTSLYGEVGQLWNIGGKSTVRSSAQGTFGVKVNL